LAERRSHGGIVEGTDNPLRSTLPDPTFGSSAEILAPNRRILAVDSSTRYSIRKITGVSMLVLMLGIAGGTEINFEFRRTLDAWSQ
jgi:hypothetical protein